MTASDFRSDTVTLPTEDMYRAMRDAPLGDDIFGDDPTVRELEELAARKTGKEASLFVPSGSMSNNIAIAVQTRPGQAILAEERNHSLNFEAGGPAVIAGVITRTYPSASGVPDPREVAARMVPGDMHMPRTALLLVENTANMHGGAVVDVPRMAELHDVARQRGVPLHLDGARVFNAAVALGVDAREICAHAQTVNFCLSKGLSCPVGSLLCGTRETVEAGRFMRKTLGGAMRQAGILAACGIVALNSMIDRLAEDHENARRLAEGLAEIPQVRLDPETVRTNIVIFELDGPPEVYAALQAGLAEDGVLALSIAGRAFRFVTHRHITPNDVDRALTATRRVLAAME